MFTLTLFNNLHSNIIVIVQLQHYYVLCRYGLVLITVRVMQSHVRDCFQVTEHKIIRNCDADKQEGFC